MSKLLCQKKPWWLSHRWTGVHKVPIGDFFSEFPAWKGFKQLWIAKSKVISIFCPMIFKVVPGYLGEKAFIISTNTKTNQACSIFNPDTMVKSTSLLYFLKAMPGPGKHRHYTSWMMTEFPCEPTKKKPPTFLYWLVNRHPFNGVL